MIAREPPVRGTDWPMRIGSAGQESQRDECRDLPIDDLGHRARVGMRSSGGTGVSEDVAVCLVSGIVLGVPGSTPHSNTLARKDGQPMREERLRIFHAAARLDVGVLLKPHQQLRQRVHFVIVRGIGKRRMVRDEVVGPLMLRPVLPGCWT